MCFGAISVAMCDPMRRPRTPAMTPAIRHASFRHPYMIAVSIRAATAAGYLFFTLLAAFCAQAQERPANRVVLLDRIVALVNDQVITRRDLDDRMKTVLTQLRQQGTPLPPTDVLERQVLERMIQNRAQ